MLINKMLYKKQNVLYMIYLTAKHFYIFIIFLGFTVRNFECVFIKFRTFVSITSLSEKYFSQ